MTGVPEATSLFELQAQYDSYYAEKYHIHAQLRGFVEGLRAIPSPQSPATYSVLGGPVRDYRICTDDPHGSYADEAEMNFQLRPASRSTTFDVSTVKNYNVLMRSLDHIPASTLSFSTHSNLAQHNVMVDNGRVTGIVHW